MITSRANDYLYLGAATLQNMSKHSGEIYFIREVDVDSNGDLTNFVKIGLVAKDRTSEERLKEHQTGNPRKLSLETKVSTELVSRVEAQLHRQYASSRVRGEWFELPTDEQLSDAIESAKSLAVDAKKMAATLAEAEALDKLPSNGQTRQADQADLDLAERVFFSGQATKEIDSLRKLIKSKGAQAYHEGADVKERFAETRVQGSPKFDEKLFKEKEPELYEAFCEIGETTTWKHNFNLKFKPAEGVSLANYHPDFYEEFEGLTRQVHAASTHEEILDLFDIDADLEGLEGFWEWEYELSKAELQVKVGQDLGIEGICVWERKEEKKTTKILLVENLIFEFPEVYQKYTVAPKGYVYGKIRQIK